MSSFEVKGWCPGALRPMMSGDGLVVRVRPHGGRLTQTQAQSIAIAAKIHGSGVIDLSARANVQLRGVRADSHLALLDALADLGLLDPDVETETHRNLIVTPFWQTGDGTEALAAAVEAALADAPALPAKFGFAIDTGPAPILAAVSTDIRLERSVDGTLILRPDGAMFGKPVSAEEAAEAALALANWFLDTGGVTAGRGRMAAHIARGTPLPPGFTTAPANAMTPPGPGIHPGGALVGFAFGQLHADTLMTLAQHGALRVTPWRMLLVEGATSLPEIDSLITDPADPRLRVTACTGAPGCPQALQPTRPLAHMLAPLVPQGAYLHVSGCAKGCALPGPAAFTLTATVAGFDLIRNGKASDTPTHAGMTPDAIRRHPETLFKAL
ncbi:ferredoxin-nitrite reductase [mine drainage metagenome]|uniref:Ferredoxin-nitrite reductase n=1 Tax=mine drainage metagenome TaxID=410659 RepID=A0A1J5PSV6_9ZZZZ